MNKEDGTLSKKVDQFLKVFKKGDEFTKELLSENEKLRYKIAQLEEAGPSGGGDDSPTVHALEEKIKTLEQEHTELIDRYRHVEEENHYFANRYLEVETENNQLANLYVASHHLHSTLDFGESLRIILEIVINLIGAEKFTIMMLDERGKELSVIAQEGMEPEEQTAIPLGEGTIVNVVRTGEAYYREGDPTDLTGVDLTHPLVCIPLKIKEHVIGVIAIYRLLEQKEGFSNIDYELFSLLAGHAAAALFSSKLYSLSESRLTTIQSFIALLKDNGNKPVC